MKTSHLDSHGTTDIKPEMLSGVKTGNGTPHDKYYICCITHVCTNIFMLRRIMQSDFYFDEAHTALDIFRFTAIFLDDFLEPKCCIWNMKYLLYAKKIQQGLTLFSVFLIIGSTPKNTTHQQTLWFLESLYQME